MVKLFAIMCYKNEITGYVGNKSVLTHEGFDVKYIPEENLHDEDTGIVLFFSRGKATVVRDRIMELANDHKAGHGVVMDVVTEVFDQEIADELMSRTWTFKYEQEDD